ncbi:unnamed protein product [Cyclocybe aegerita]|uniref:Uncharacterized protein n=1 Tax=Cyclocybe aegerita TaxID=1973307 RepID=A0A8S0X8M1_CYCAE|nr:unnamed protein product [Cyclocybe aegerita]
MSLDHQRSLVFGYENQTNAVRASLSIFGRLPAGSCKTPPTCGVIFKELFLEIATSRTRNALWTWNGKKSVTRKLDRVCKTCRRTAKEHRTEDRKALWDSLPRMYDFICSWDKFRQREEQVLSNIGAFIEAANSISTYPSKDSPAGDLWMYGDGKD